MQLVGFPLSADHLMRRGWAFTTHVGRPTMMIARRRTQRWFGPVPYGQELVEIALLIPLLLLIAFGVLDMGRVFHAAITMNNAAREGARYGSFNPTDSGGIMAATLQEAQSSGVDLTASTITVTCPSGCTSGGSVEVTIEYDFQMIMGLALPSTTLTLVRSAEMMIP